jgi:hypothetical protein
VTRKRKDPADRSKFHPICNPCNQAYLERLLLGPFLSNSEKLKKLVEVREADMMGLNFVRQEVEGQLNLKKQKVGSGEEEFDQMTEDEQRHEKLHEEVAVLTVQIDALAREIKQSKERSKELDEEVMKHDRAYEDKWKLMNEL